MELGGVTRFGMPDNVPVWIDARAMDCEKIILGVGIRELIRKPRMMSYLQSLWRAELLGLASLMIVALTGSIFLTVYPVPLSNISPTVLRNIVEAFLGVCAFGFLPVLIYGAPIFAVYLSKPAFRLGHVLVFAALPGLIMLLFSNLAWLYFLSFGLGVAITMEIVSRLWPRTFGRDTA